MKLQFKVIMLLCLVCCVCSCRLLFPRGSSEKLSLAEEALRQDKYDRAIELYQSHMNNRLKLKEREEWENPYFYSLMIGDIHLKANRPDQALLSYQTAQEKKIDPALISDRYRFMASWYESKGRRKEALDLLGKYRELDPLLFDAMADRIAKALVMEEEKITPTPTPAK